MVWFSLYFTMALYGLIFTWTLQHKRLLKKTASSSLAAQIFTEPKSMQTGVHLEETMLIT